MRITDRINEKARPLRSALDLQPLYDRVGEAGVVMLGEATHGTHEFYVWRSQITKDLVANQGFNFIAVEGDWPDCYEVNRYIRGIESAKSDSRDVLQTFNRWPTWMWANQDIRELIEWLRDWNSRRRPEHQVGFYGLDVYSLWESMDAIIAYLQKNDQAGLQQAYEAYRCFEPYGRNLHAYAQSTAFVSDDCRDEVAELLVSLRQRAEAEDDSSEAQFNAEQNALVARSAEDYYRTMMKGDADSWNIRDRHMMATLARLLGRYGPDARGVVWAHNTHIGDARFTDMLDDGMVNIGQLAREAFDPEGVVLVGFGTYRGDVIAGDYWGGPMKRMPVPDARHGSVEEFFHESAHGDCLWVFDDDDRADYDLSQWRGHRAIGVVYNPVYEAGNYVPTRLSGRYDAFIHIEETRALNPLVVGDITTEEVPETYPTGI